MTRERVYSSINSASFRKTKEENGGLSNMAAGFPIKVNNIQIQTSEALYQAMRYPDHSWVQNEIISQNSPMTAKMKSKKYREYNRKDWNDIRILIMRWCLRVKLVQNWDSFSTLLLNTKEKNIVENSKRDLYWGAALYDDGTFRGVNALGRLLMELREELPIYLEKNCLTPPNINNFKLLGEDIKPISFKIINHSNLIEGHLDTKNKKEENLTIFDINE